MILTTESIDRVKRELRPIASCADEKYSSAVIDYFTYYGLQYDGIRHEFGTFWSNGYTLAAHIFSPPLCNGVALLMHGYFDHCGLMSTITRCLLDGGYAVAMYDMPGHGLSSGKPSSIDSFQTYTSVLESFIQICRNKFDLPLYAIGHSTGGGVLIDHALSREKPGFDKAILIAPLVRSYLWQVSRLNYCVAHRFLKEVPRVFRKSTSNVDFLDFTRNRDPLQNWQLPLEWVGALSAWNDRIADSNPVALPVLVIQGTRDTVVDWKYNIPFIQHKFPKASVQLIPGANHQLFNETDTFRKKVFDSVISYLA